MLDQIEESLEISSPNRAAQLNRPPQVRSLLTLKRNSRSFGDSPEKSITIYWYDSQQNVTHEFNQTFSEALTLGDVCKWCNLQVTSLTKSLINEEESTLYLPKKKQGKPNEDFPAFRNEMQIKDCDQTKFALKITLLNLIREQTPPKIEKRASYNNSLNKSKSNEKKVSISEQKKKQKSIFFCFCYSGE